VNAIKGAVSNRDRSIAAAIVAELNGLSEQALRTITHDNDGEIAKHDTVKDGIGMPAYFCDLHSPWQRGGIGEC